MKLLGALLIGGSLLVAQPAQAVSLLTCQLPGYMMIQAESMQFADDPVLNCRDRVQDRDYTVSFSAFGSGVYFATRSGVSLLCVGTGEGTADLRGEEFYGAHISANAILGARAGVFYGVAGSCYLLGLNALAIGADVSSAKIEIR
jgi:hypothetical protein